VLEKDVNAWLSRDRQSRKEFAQDPYCGIKFTAYAFRDLFEGVEFVTGESNVDRVRKDLPILMISGEKDPVGGNGKMVQKAYQIYKKVGIKNISLKLYKDMRHEILNEVGKQGVYKDIIGWINKQI
ncbi:MAG: serine aminopeptidase domain-containing protein, partial [Peptostreptococcaceae bacterium]